MTMAETAVVETTTSPTGTVTHDLKTSTHHQHNNNHPFVANHNSTRPVGKQRKRKRLSQVLDKLTGVQQVSSAPATPTINNNIQQINNNIKEEEDANTRALKTPKQMSEVFRFDSTDRERYHQASEDEDVFSPASSSNKSPHSSSDSPRISFSPLRLKEDDASSSPPLPRPSCHCYSCVTGVGHHPPPLHPYDRFFPASPISPLTPASPAPTAYSFEHYLHSKYLPDIFRRRSHSDSDLPLWFEAAKAERARVSLGWPHPLTVSTGGGRGM